MSMFKAGATLTQKIAFWVWTALELTYLARMVALLVKSMRELKEAQQQADLAESEYTSATRASVPEEDDDEMFMFGGDDEDLPNEHSLSWAFRNEPQA